jgi:hypothetical protein
MAKRYPEMDFVEVVYKWMAENPGNYGIAEKRRNPLAANASHWMWILKRPFPERWSLKQQRKLTSTWRTNLVR